MLGSEQRPRPAQAGSGVIAVQRLPLVETGVQGDDVGGGERAAGLSVPASRPRGPGSALLPQPRLCTQTPWESPPSSLRPSVSPHAARWTRRPVLGIQ